MKLAHPRRPNAPLPHQKINQYKKIMTALSDGFINIKVVTLSVDHHVSLKVI